MNVMSTRFSEKSKVLKSAQYRISSLEMELEQYQKLSSLGEGKLNLEVMALEEKCRRLLLLLEEQTTLRIKCEEKLEADSAHLTSRHSLQFEVSFSFSALSFSFFSVRTKTLRFWWSIRSK
jgi:DNA gyrase/topoisomerase IV subunit A